MTNFVPLSPLLSGLQSFTILVYRQKKGYKSENTVCRAPLGVSDQPERMDKDAFTTKIS
jgi:hypothetical protein